MSDSDSDSDKCTYVNGWGPTSIGTITKSDNRELFLSGSGWPRVKGDKPEVVCNGWSYECDTLKEAQAKAAELAHTHSADAYILKPIRKVSPKRDVITTNLE